MLLSESPAPVNVGGRNQPDPLTFEELGDLLFAQICRDELAPCPTIGMQLAMERGIDFEIDNYHLIPLRNMGFTKGM